MSDSLRNRIAVIAASHVYNEWHCDEAEQCYCGKCGPSWPDHLADVVIRELGLIPNRSFIDDRNNRWEWCGGEPGTWAWRMTRLGPEPLHSMYPRNPNGCDYEPF